MKYNHQFKGILSRDFMDLEYSLIGNIDLLQANKIIEALSCSRKVEIADELPDGRLSHIVIKDTTTPVGYIGNETLEKVNPNDKKLKPYHDLLKGIYRIVTNTNEVF